MDKIYHQQENRSNAWIGNSQDKHNQSINFEDHPIHNPRTTPENKVVSFLSRIFYAGKRGKGCS